MPARVMNVSRTPKKVVLAIQYYGGEEEIPFVEMKEGEENFESALSMQIGDEVLASPCEENRIYKFFHYRWMLQRLYVIVFKGLFTKLMSLLRPLL